MPEERKSAFTPEQVREFMREWEAEPQSYDPDLARTYAGEWVLLYRGQVVAHGSKGSDLVQAGQAQKYPGARLIYVPTLEQQEGVWLLPMLRLDP